MKKFQCQCGQAVFFESTRCVNCGAVLGFDPDTMSMHSLTSEGDSRLVDGAGNRYERCDNGERYQVCNWLRPAGSAHPLCWGCQFNRTIPYLGNPRNLQRWHTLEQAKKRLLYTLRDLGLPLENGFQNPDNGLLFDFVEDRRSNPDRYAETFVHTGYHGGIITINALEADDVAREATRVEMNESYRTVIGHMRHESGHYFWSLLSQEAGMDEAFVAIFGNPDAEYDHSLRRYYADGPAADWAGHYISPYASAHPFEDWAESWGHYLHIHDALETAAAHGVIEGGVMASDIGQRIGVWRELSITLNELNRSIGLGDAYPFILNAVVEEKLRFIDRVIDRLGRSRSEMADR